jgi:hypothetical protein
MPLNDTQKAAAENYLRYVRDTKAEAITLIEGGLTSPHTNAESLLLNIDALVTAERGEKFISDFLKSNK